MRALLFFFALVPLIGLTIPLPAQMPDPALTPKTKTEQAWDAYHRVDHQLNDVYQAVMKSLVDDTARQKLAASQQAWLLYRSAQGDFDADYARGGPLVRQLTALSYTQTTLARIAELKSYLRQAEAEAPKK